MFIIAKVYADGTFEETGDEYKDATAARDHCYHVEALGSPCKDNHKVFEWVELWFPKVLFRTLGKKEKSFLLLELKKDHEDNFWASLQKMGGV